MAILGESEAQNKGDFKAHPPTPTIFATHSSLRGRCKLAKCGFEPEWVVKYVDVGGRNG